MLELPGGAAELLGARGGPGGEQEHVRGGGLRDRQQVTLRAEHGDPEPGGVGDAARGHGAHDVVAEPPLPVQGRGDPVDVAEGAHGDHRLPEGPPHAGIGETAPQQQPVQQQQRRTRREEGEEEGARELEIQQVDEGSDDPEGRAGGVEHVAVELRTGGELAPVVPAEHRDRGQPAQRHDQGGAGDVLAKIAGRRQDDLADGERDAHCQGEREHVRDDHRRQGQQAQPCLRRALGPRRGSATCRRSPLGIQIGQGPHSQVPGNSVQWPSTAHRQPPPPSHTPAPDRSARRPAALSARGR